MLFLGFITAIAYVPGWTGMLMITTWGVLSILLPFYLTQPVTLGAAHWLGLSFLTYAAASLARAPVWQQGVGDLWQLCVLAACFLLGESRDLRRLYVGFALGIGVNDAVAGAQWLGYHPVFQVASTHEAGLFVNPDMLGEAATLATLGLLAHRIWWALPLTLAPVAFTGSRASLVALTICGVIWLTRRYRLAGLVASALALAAVGWVVTDRHRDSTVERLAIWQDTIGGLTVRGHGVGSFFILYPEYAKRTDTMLTRPESAHNDYLEMLFEFGIGAAPLFVLLALGAVTRGTEQYVVLGFLTLAFFSFPIRVPAEGALGLAALGSLCRGWPLPWPHSYFSRCCGYAGRVLTGREGFPLEPLRPRATGLRGNRSRWADV